MKVLVLAPALYRTSPGQRFRIEQWGQYLQRDGFHFTYDPFEDDSLHEVIYDPGRFAPKAGLIVKALVRRLALLPRVKHFDVVYVFREASLIGPAIIETVIARHGIPMVFDFDDAIWTPYVSPANKYLSHLKFFGKTAGLCRMSRYVLAGNAHLARYARRYNRQVAVIPTTIDTDVYRVRPLEDTHDRPVSIGWTGSYSTVQHLDILRRVLSSLRRRHAFRLVVIGTHAYKIDGVDVVTKPWNADSEVEDLQEFDIGIMPLPDDNWSRGKCGLKLLQCMAIGVPVVGSPVGVNSEIIQDGIQGFLASTEEEWIARLSLLIRDAALRRRLGMAGRQRVEECYSARVWVPRVRSILEEVAHRR
jgi:glycosyltransferase involved in cell wall biosynthesis